jgi:N-acetylneuraminic acid mutarotase
MAAVWTGTKAFVFGGCGDPCDANHCTADIFEYDLRLDLLIATGDALPTTRSGAAAFWDGKFAYVVAGTTCPGFTNEIVRYDPATHEVRVMESTLTEEANGETAPAKVYYPAIVWTGQKAYIFGGENNLARYRRIWMFDPAADTIQQMNAQITPGRGQLAAVWVGNAALLFGGCKGGNPPCETDEILRYDPAKDTITQEPTRLPVPFYGEGAAWDGTWAYIFGGYGSNGARSENYRYHPGTHTLQPDAGLPFRLYRAATASTNGTALIFGGSDGSAHYKSILQFHPGGAAPPTTTAPSPDCTTNCPSTSPTTGTSTSRGGSPGPAFAALLCVLALAAGWQRAKNR